MDFELDDFAPEPSTASVGTGSATVGDVVAASVPLHWDEAVAILQELIDVGTALHRDDIPAFENVEITADGTLTIRGNQRGERGPLAAGRALHTLLASADVPVALRLFVSQANAPETHASLAAFAKGLAYFGKTDRAGLIRAVHSRYSAIAGTGPTATTVKPSAPSPPATPVSPQRRPMASGAVRRALTIAAAAVAIVSAGAAAVLLIDRYMHRESAATQDTKATAPANSATAAPATKRNVAADSKGRSIADAKPKTLQPQTSSGRVNQLSLQELVPPIAAPLPGTRMEKASVAAAPEPLARPTPSLPQPAASRARTDRRADVIYSRDDADVQPPVMTYPQLPSPLMIGSPSEAFVNRMELVVAADGSVERVRLVNTPRRMSDMMLLSGAKVWKFAPAIKDGVPVRYRTTVSWTVFP